MEHTGAQSHVDAVVEGTKGWVSGQLQEQLGMTPGKADLLTAGGVFGVMFGLSTLGGESKVKVLQAAKDVNEKIKVAQKNLTFKHNTSKVVYETSRQARREAMRKVNIPTSQQPIKQTYTKVDNQKVGRQYEYNMPKKGGGLQKKIVTDQTTDRVPGHGPHWEAGSVKIPQRKDPLGRLRVYNSDKAKTNYAERKFPRDTKNEKQ